MADILSLNHLKLIFMFKTHCRANFLCRADQCTKTAKCNGKSGIPDKCQHPKLNLYMGLSYSMSLPLIGGLVMWNIEE